MVAYISDLLECLLPKIRVPPCDVSFPAVFEIIQPPSDFISVLVPSVVINRARLVSN